MPIHSEKRLISYAPEQLFDLVMDIEKYPKFLPWVTAARVLERNEKENFLTAELVVRFNAFSSNYISKVSYCQPGMTPKGSKEWAVYVDLESGPFTHLENRWVLHPVDKGKKCEVEFFLDFALESRMLDAMIGGLFDKAVHKMVSAFETRAKELYS